MFAALPSATHAPSQTAFVAVVLLFCAVLMILGHVFPKDGDKIKPA